jgi:hypothetical protein
MSISCELFRRRGRRSDVSCVSSLDRACIPARPVPELKRPAWLDHQERNRLWAVTYLVAAAKEGDAVERNSLRRRAAELILARPSLGASETR